MKSQLMHANRIEAERYGIVWVHNLDNPIHGQWEAVCKCGETIRKAWAIARPVEMMLKQLRKTGWLLGLRHQPICPSCATDTREHIVVTKEATVTELPHLIPNPKIARAVFRLLEENFDAEAGRYAGEWSDDLVAKEAQTSPQFVAKTRREGFGEITEDPEVTRMRELVVNTRTEVEAAMKMAGEALGKMERQFQRFEAERKIGGK